MFISILKACFAKSFKCSYDKNSGSMTVILLTEITLSDDTNIPIQSTTTTTTDSSTASNDDRNYPSQLETKQIYDIEDKFELNYKRLHDDLKKINYEQVNKEGKSLIKQIFKSAPLFLLDEVDVALDNTNIGKVADFIREQLASKFQCIIISLKEQFYSRAGALIAIFPKPGDCITSYCFTLGLNQYDERENIANRRG
ncbi:unnamed protein product [Rotaria socialis]|uniref:RecF/RecN/SMC N-terminal domain-containing protein n=2 Tax=Rotaria socialis TaxID=392032 RepID=A0A821GZX6_9BILA|nr:unnamed protein product [Rotaria socialis]CAF4148518.1 unnamed protein product [Rotaria socialis]CAF4266969.1 unnamed protein product [Rotaria socialis]CAF4489056.1 unnamed protein product [Rotaria socialis]CAF4675238.1 unnamed protein product [Rotaria socialis]